MYMLTLYLWTVWSECGMHSSHEYEHTSISEVLQIRPIVVASLLLRIRQHVVRLSNLWRSTVTMTTHQLYSLRDNQSTVQSP